MCGTKASPEAALCPSCGHILGDGSPRKAAPTRRSDSSVVIAQVLSFGIGIPGFLLQGWGYAAERGDTAPLGFPPFLLMLVGSFMLATGLGLAAAVKGRSFFWGLLGLLGLLGLIVLGFLKRCCTTCGKVQPRGAKECAACRTPV
jgi:hypothetical protein